MSKSLIKKLLRKHFLREEMKPSVSKDFGQRGLQNIKLIATDDNSENEHYLMLLVNLEKQTNSIYEYTYGFYTLDKNENTTGKIMYRRDEVSKYLPQQLKGQIMSYIVDMTRDLIIRINPKQITRQTMERLEDDSLKRYEKITNLFVNELGYKQKRHTEHNGLHEWLFVKNDGSEMTLNENELLNYKFSKIEEKVMRMNKVIRELHKDPTLAEELLRSRK